MHPQVQGIAPRSIYTSGEEARAWTRAREAARGNIRPVTVRFGRKLLGVVQGLDPFSSLTRSIPMRQGAPWSTVERALVDLRDERTELFQKLHGRMNAMPFNNEDAINESISGGKFSRTQFAKTPTANHVANNWFDGWTLAGNPGAGAITGTARTAVRFSDTSTGAITHRGNVSTDTKHVLSLLAIATANTPLLMFADRVIAYDQCSITNSNQTMTNTLTALRYQAAAPGLLPCMVTNTVMSATATDLTQFRYTSDTGVALQSMPTASPVSLIVSSAAPTATLGARVCAPSTTASTLSWGYHLPLAAGDNGVRLVADYTWSVANTGTFTCVLMHPICELVLPVATIPAEIDYIHQMAEIERIYDGACLNLWYYTPSVNAYTVQGTLRYAWHS